MDDFEALLRLQLDPKMMRYMSDGHVFTPSETRSWLTCNADLWEEKRRPNDAQAARDQRQGP